MNFAIAVSMALAQSPARPFEPPVLELQTGHTGSVLFMAISPDGRLVASSAEHGPVKLWSVASGLEIRSFSPGKAYSVVDIDFTGDSSGLFIRTWAGFADYEVGVWELTTGRELRRFNIGTDIRGTALGPDGRQLAVARNRGVELWSMETGRRTRNIGRGPADALAFTIDGKALAVAGAGQLTLWDTGSGTQRISLSTLVKTESKLRFSPDGRWLAFHDSALRIWIWDMLPRSQPRLLAPLSAPTLFEFSADSRELAVHESRSGRSTAFDPATGHQTRPFADRIPGLAFAVAIGSNGRLLAGGGGNSDVVVADMRSRRQLAALEGVVESMSAVAVSPDDRYLVTAGKLSISLWDTSRGVRSAHRMFAHLGGINALAFHPDGRVFASASTDGLIKVWEVESMRELKPLQTSGPVYSLAFSKDGNWLAAGGWRGQLAVWEVASWRQRVQLTGHDDSVQAVDFSPNGQWLVSAQAFGPVKLWDVAQARQLTELVRANDDVESTDSVQFSPDGQYLAVGLGNRIRLLEIGAGHRVRSSRSLEGHTETVQAVTFSSDGRWLASASLDRTVKLWDVRRAREIRTFQGHTNWVNDVVFDHTGRWLASAGMDGAVRLWDVAAGDALGTILSASRGWLAVAPDGLFDGEPAAMPQVAWRWSGVEATPLEAYFNDFFHPALLADLLSGARPRAAIDIATALQVPGLRTMLAGKLAHIERREDAAVVCFEHVPGAAVGVGPTDRRMVFPPVAGYRPGSTPTCRFEKPLTVPSESVDAVIRRLQKAADTPAPSRSAGALSETRTSRLHVFVAGITQYAPERGFDPLTYAVPSARGIQEFFALRGGSARKAYADVVVWDGLMDSNATRENIQKRFSEMTAAVQADDVVLVYLAGHGKVSSGEEMFYFVPADGNAADLRQTAVNTAMIADALRRLAARRVVIILDTCQSGGAIEALSKVASVKASVEMRRAGDVGIYLIAAAMPLSYAIGAREGRSALAEALLAALTATDQATISQVTEYLRVNLPEVSERLTGGFRQVPLISTIGSDFLLALR